MIDPHCPIANCSDHDLFNELHRRIVSYSGEANLQDSATLNRIYKTIDELHHDFTDIIERYS